MINLWKNFTIFGQIQYLENFQIFGLKFSKTEAVEKIRWRNRKITNDIVLANDMTWIASKYLVGNLMMLIDNGWKTQILYTYNNLIYLQLAGG